MLGTMLRSTSIGSETRRRRSTVGFEVSKRIHAVLTLSLLAALTLSSCTGDSKPPASSPTPAPKATPTARPAQDTAADTVDRFLRAWQESRFEDMYGLLSSSAQASITKERFVQRYQGIAAEATIQAISYSIPAQADDTALEVPYTVTITTGFFGDIAESRQMPLTRESGWRIAWTPAAIFNGLDGDNLIHLFYTSPGRGAILDRNGQPLAMDANVPSVGVVPGKIQDRQSLIQTLSRLLNMDAETVNARISVQAQPDWFVPVKTLPYGTPDQLISDLKQVPGVAVRQETVRVYPYGTLASHVVGYVTKTTADDLKMLAAAGYTEEDWIGRAGIEQSQEAALAGKKGGKLTVMSPSGNVIKVIAEKEGSAPADVHLTIDATLQQKVETLLGDHAGTIAVVDPTDNSILALASHPGFDPNGFVRGLTTEEWKSLSEGPQHPLLHRAVSGAYPPGSLFKVVTMAAGLEKGGFTPASTFACTPTWNGLGADLVMSNWRSDDRGTLDLVTGLAESCNPVFYEIGKKLDQLDPNILPSFAQQFGLGKPTDVEGLAEATGLVPDPTWKKSTKNQPWYAGDTVNMAIGQGYLLATPLQMANLFSAVVTGQVQTPVLIQKIMQKEQTVKTFSAVRLADLPVSEANLRAIREGMVAVVNDPRGTAYQTFQGIAFSAAGKSGTAEDEGTDSHAWFVAYAPVESPKVVALVMLEEGGFGAKNAGPIARQVLDAYLSK